MNFANVTLLRFPTHRVQCLFLNKVDSFLALFFNTCLPVLNWLTGREND